jgi:alkylation response protein AidB-like acyl-CoA dehydrogenase
MTLSSEEREALRSTARTLLSRSSSSEQVRAAIATESGYDPELWAQIVALGWTSIHVPEAGGGAGCGYADLVVVAHELGRALTPSPFLASAVLATGALVEADHLGAAEGPLAALVAGESVGAVAFASTSGSYEAAQLGVAWSSEGSTVRLDGTAGFVLDADLADVLIVGARGGDGAAVAVVTDTAGLRIDRVPTVDLTRRLFTVSFDDVRVPSDRLLADPGHNSARLLDRVLSLGVVAAAADAVGAAEQALETTATYARERTQFGKPIGTFQAVKHHCANMAVNVEAGRAATRAAAAELDQDPAGWATTAAVTASYVGPACSAVCALAMRVHGGIGFTWEHDTHMQMKRVKLDEVLFGSPSWHRRRLADAVFPSLVTT